MKKITALFFALGVIMTTLLAQTSGDKYFIVKPKTAQGDNRAKLRSVFGADLISMDAGTGGYLVRAESLATAKEKVKSVLPDASVKEAEKRPTTPNR